ncbi:hypothetical protein HanRHA438_Chr01g0003931 [Helianthus annuus]|nr:hypothetical protein HanRHA438_Chr01g0003931 [Helianthus annuus]
MDAREWNASMERIESMLVEIINFLKNRTRLTPPSPTPASATPPQTLPPTSVPATATLDLTATPPPASATILSPKQLPLTFPFVTNTLEDDKKPLVTLAPPQKTNPNILLAPPIVPLFHPTSQKRNKSVAPTPNLAPSSSVFGPYPSLAILTTKAPAMTTATFTISSTKNVTNPLKKVVFLVPTKKKLTSVKGAFGKPEWRPPWRLILETAPNSIVRVEWRPPWFPPSRILIFALRTSRVRVGWNDTCP